MRLWHLSPSVNSVFKHTCAAIHWCYTSDFWSRPFVYVHTLFVLTAKALARLRGCAVLPEPSLFAYAISTIISWAVSFVFSLQLGLCLDFQAYSKIDREIVGFFFSENRHQDEINVYFFACLVPDNIRNASTFCEYTDSKKFRYIIWARSCENVSYDICEQQRRRSACASAQSDQHLCCSHLR